MGSPDHRAVGHYWSESMVLFPMWRETVDDGVRPRSARSQTQQKISGLFDNSGGGSVAEPQATQENGNLNQVPPVSSKIQCRDWMRSIETTKARAKLCGRSTSEGVEMSQLPLTSSLWCIQVSWRALRFQCAMQKQNHTSDASCVWHPLDKTTTLCENHDVECTNLMRSPYQFYTCSET